ncbi:hypothetical protein JIN85_11515 [Luteolibacter pohnpeiensis]|uniref:PEP-CTERM protein-sorting domain-containing protein n=1 Tax=Luteolibacter pohnpeiensis TaxID=454153 RepID=A0A934SBC3_9BACT|nr:hypothetical protein [Luteolibacter pohnpeiensis]MBK1883047.1 hypothetical protein [Luteolibacter pohnpeiensis]
MKSLKLSLFSLALLPASTLSAAVVYDFQSESDYDYFDGEVSGWTQSESNPVLVDGTAPLGEVETLDYFGTANKVGVFGTAYNNSPFNATTSVSGALPASTSLVNSQVSLDFAIANDAAVRDSFSIAITDLSSTTVASIIFTPDSGDSTLWTISYTIGGSSGSTTFSLTANAEYSFYFNFNDSTTSLFYGGYGESSSLIATSTTSFDSSAELGDIVISNTQTDFETDAGNSTNVAIFDNIATAVIPEPSVALLGGIAGLGLLRRRRSN